MGKLQPRKVYYYTGPDFDDIKSGDAHSIWDWAIIIESPYTSLYARLFRSYRFTKRGYLSQGHFNQSVNPKSADDKNRTWVEIDPEYLTRKRVIRENVIAELKNGRTTRVIAKLLHISQEVVTQVRISINKKHIIDHTNDMHKCKCPTCGEYYYHRGFYTGKGMWRRMHDKNDCPVQNDDRRRRVYKSEIRVTGLDIRVNNSVS